MRLDWEPPRLELEELDVQHRQILRRIGRLSALAAEGREDAAPAELRFLERYLDEHFAAEERWMADEGYPAAAEHARAHADGRARVAAARAGLAADGLGVVADHLAAWLVAHMEDHDVRFGRFRIARENLRRLAEPGGARAALTPVPRLGGLPPARPPK